MTATILRLIALALAALLYCVSARASTTEDAIAVTPKLVCTVGHAISSSFNARQCDAISDALARTSEPKNLLAMMVIESEMDWEAQAWYVLDGRVVVDVGLLGIHCVVGRKGLCTNWPVKGVRPIDGLQVLGRNIEAGARVLAKKRQVGGVRGLDHYAGDLDGHTGYSANVAALVAAFGGVKVQVKSKRVRELARKIAKACAQEPRS